MMNFKYISIICLLCLASLLFSQNLNNEGQIVITVGNSKVSLAEFERIFKKNNQDSVINKQSLDEYLDLFIKFKLKVVEAQHLGLDTSQSFVSELNGYKKQLIKPYFTDDNVIDSLVKEAYDRMKYELLVSHILIKIDKDAPPSDTVKAYNRALKIRERIVKGEEFEAVAKETSDDQYVNRFGGKIGYITAFSTVYPFENAAYDLEPGAISQPVRTQFGYHIIKVHEKRPSMGKVRVAHIMKAIPRNADPKVEDAIKDTIYMIYDSIQQGADFAETAKKYSVDRNSAIKGGELPWFGSGRMLPEFEKASFELEKPGDVSKPVKTVIGFHIIKLLEKEELKDFESMKSEIQAKVKRDGRASLSKEIVIQRIKKDYNFKETGKHTSFYKIVDNSVFDGNWDVSKASKLKKDLFSFADKYYSQQDFAQYIAAQGKTKPIPIETYINTLYNDFVNEKLIAYEESMLEVKYPDFKYLLKEYHDGILLFNLTDSLVWSKAVKDTSGLKDFYEKNKNNYMWDNRLRLKSFTYTDIKKGKKLNKLLLKKEKKGLSFDEILKMINTDSAYVSMSEEKIYSKGEVDYIDAIFDAQIQKQDFPGIVSLDSKNMILWISEKIGPQPKELDEAKGMVTADYQNYLEEEWVKELKNKYEVSVNKDLLYTIK